MNLWLFTNIQTDRTIFCLLICLWYQSGYGIYRGLKRHRSILLSLWRLIWRTVRMWLYEWYHLSVIKRYISRFGCFVLFPSFIEVCLYTGSNRTECTFGFLIAASFQRQELSFSTKVGSLFFGKKYATVR